LFEVAKVIALDKTTIAVLRESPAESAGGAWQPEAD
jgi:hypothetical protein